MTDEIATMAAPELDPFVGEPELGAPGAVLAIISGPSGVGKDTIIAELEKVRAGHYHYVVTCTTRKPRDDEKDGKHYHFLTVERFIRLRESRAFLEWAPVYGNLYASPCMDTRRGLVADRDVILKLNIEGANSVKKLVPEALRIFIKPPSIESLRARLQKRKSETDAELEIRFAASVAEMDRAVDYDYTVINEDGKPFESAVEIDRIIRDERARHPDRQLLV